MATNTKNLLVFALLMLPWTCDALYTEIGGGILVATGAALVGPVILPTIGFTSGGIAAGSAAASFMSYVYTSGGVGMTVLSAAQSAGALGTVGTVAIATSGAVTAGAIKLVRRLARI